MWPFRSGKITWRRNVLEHSENVPIKKKGWSDWVCEPFSPSSTLPHPHFHGCFDLFVFALFWPQMVAFNRCALPEMLSNITKLKKKGFHITFSRSSWIAQRFVWTSMKGNSSNYISQIGARCSRHASTKLKASIKFFVLLLFCARNVSRWIETSL